MCVHKKVWSANVECRALPVHDVKRETRILPVGVGAFMPEFYGKESSLAKMLIPFDR